MASKNVPRRRDSGFIFKPFSEKQLKILTCWSEGSPVKDKFLIMADGSVRSGKAIYDDAKIPSPSGEVRFGDLQVGDIIFDRLGNPTEVLEVYPQGEKELFEIEFNDGSKTVCSKNHLWSYYTNGSTKFKTSTLEEIMFTLDYCKSNLSEGSYKSVVRDRYRFPINGCVEFESREVPVDPKLLGMILANYSSDDKYIVVKGTYASDIYEYAQSISVQCNLYSEERCVFDKKVLGIYRKDNFLDAYKFNSKEIREEFISGFISVSRIYVSTGKKPTAMLVYYDDNKIKRNIIYILRSLGIYTRSDLSSGIGIRISENIRKLLPSRISSIVYDSKHLYRTIKNIVKLGEGDCTCIVVDNKEHLFLVNDFIVTHNTVVCALSFVLYVMNTFEFQNAALIGKSIGSLKRNVLSVLKQMLFSLNYDCIEHRAENWMEVKRGNVSNYFFLFGGKDEAAQDLIQGMTLCSLFCDEVALIHKTMFYQASARLSVEKAKIFTSSNPSSPNHWFFKEWITKVEEKNGLYLHFTMDDNPSLPLGVKQRYQSMYSGIWADRYIKGLWVVAEGLIYDMFNKALNLVEDDDIPYDNAVKWNVGIDYGTGNATVFLLSMQDVEGNIYICREYYFAGRKEAQEHGDYDLQKTDLEFTDDLRTFIAENFNITGLTYRSIPIVIDPSAASFKVQVRRFHMKTKNANNSILDGIRTVGTLMKQCRLKISKSCLNLIDELGTYSWDQKAQDNGIDRPLQVNDHACDAMRYSVMHHLRKTVDDNIGQNVGV